MSTIMNLPEMAMPGGWTMSMMWMRMPGQSWPGCAITFVAMWSVMMIAMMLPSLALMLSRVRVPFASSRVTLMTAVGAGYFVVWILVGLVVFAVGAMLAQVEMEYPSISRAVPIAGAIIVVAACSLQFTKWKTRRVLECCEGPRRKLPASAFAALRFGTTLGLRCVACCANWTAILLVAGLMDVRAMAVVTLAITTERWYLGVLKNESH